MRGIRLEIPDADFRVLESKVKALLRENEKVPLRAIARIVTMVTANAKQRATELNLIGIVHGGTYRRSITGKVVRTRKGMALGIVGAWAKHAPFLEVGTRPHIIRARFAKALKIPIWRSSIRTRAKSRKYYFLKSVKHPGTRPYFVLRDALVRTIPQQVSIVEQELIRAAHRSKQR